MFIWFKALLNIPGNVGVLIFKYLALNENMSALVHIQYNTLESDM